MAHATWCIILLLALAVIVPLTTLAQPPASTHRLAPAFVDVTATAIPADAAVILAEGDAADGARAQKIDLMHQNGRLIWAVIVVSKGDKRTRVLIDAANGVAHGPTYPSEKLTRSHEEPPVLPPQLSLHGAIIRAERAVHGRVLAAFLEGEDGAAHYVVELVVRGRKIQVEMDADSGKLFPQTDEDTELWHH